MKLFASTASHTCEETRLPTDLDDSKDSDHRKSSGRRECCALLAT